GQDGRARTREVKLAVFFSQDKLDDKGYPVRDRDSSSFIATFEPASVFAGLVKAEGIRRGAGHVRQLTILGDGAAWIWNIASAKFPEVILSFMIKQRCDLGGCVETVSSTQLGMGGALGGRDRRGRRAAGRLPQPGNLIADVGLGIQP